MWQLCVQNLDIGKREINCLMRKFPLICGALCSQLMFPVASTCFSAYCYVDDMFRPSIFKGN
jgi:hypothetical protein